jgi:TPR repeat protein
MKSLGHIYEKGLVGIAPDAEAARYWYDKARTAGAK